MFFLRSGNSENIEKKQLILQSNQYVGFKSNRNSRSVMRSAMSAH